MNDNKLLHTTLTQAFEDRLHEYIPELRILRQSVGGGLVEETVPLNVYRNEGDSDLVTSIVHDTNNPQCFPFIFVRIEQRLTVGSQTVGEIMRSHYSYLISFDFYIDRNPTDRRRVPRLREELDKVDLLMERALQEIELFKDWTTGEVDIYETVQTSNVRVLDQGALLTTRTIEISEDTIIPERPKVIEVDVNIGLEGDVR